MSGDRTALFDSLFSLAGRTALVTGASGGLGARFATVLARAGAEVILAGRSANALEGLAERLSADGYSAQTLALDVTDSAAIERAFAGIEKLDILINNSGISTEATLETTSEADWDRVFDTNLKGAWAVSRAALPMLRAGPGCIVNIASILGTGVLKTVGPYAASKAGLIQLTRAMALEVARDGIRVNAIAPGYIETPINAGFFATPAGEKMLRGVPFRRLGTPEELDAALLYLVGPGAGFVTGSVVTVDGGHTLALS